MKLLVTCVSLNLGIFNLGFLNQTRHTFSGWTWIWIATRWNWCWTSSTRIPGLKTLSKIPEWTRRSWRKTNRRWWWMDELSKLDRLKTFDIKPVVPIIIVLSFFKTWRNCFQYAIGLRQSNGIMMKIKQQNPRCCSNNSVQLLHSHRHQNVKF